MIVQTLYARTDARAPRRWCRKHREPLLPPQTQSTHPAADGTACPAHCPQVPVPTLRFWPPKTDSNTLKEHKTQCHHLHRQQILGISAELTPRTREPWRHGR
eukprot:1799810-Pleurochrysis_carterae.AAC.3